MKQLSYPHGRADVVIYGLYNDLYINPIVIEAKSQVNSGTWLFHYIEQVRKSYEHALTHILAFHKIWNTGKVKDRLRDMGYAFIKVNDYKIIVLAKAEPKKVVRNTEDFSKVYSLGILYMAIRRVLKDLGYHDDINISNEWIGLNYPINYFATIHSDYAIFGIYAIKKIM